MFRSKATPIAIVAACIAAGGSFTPLGLGFGLVVLWTLLAPRRRAVTA